jgi:hypothetical protein
MNEWEWESVNGTKMREWEWEWEWESEESTFFWVDEDVPRDPLLRIDNTHHMLHLPTPFQHHTQKSNVNASIHLSEDSEVPCSLCVCVCVCVCVSMNVWMNGVFVYFEWEGVFQYATSFRTRIEEIHSADTCCQQTLMCISVFTISVIREREDITTKKFRWIFRNMIDNSCFVKGRMRRGR